MHYLCIGGPNFCMWLSAASVLSVSTLIILFVVNCLRHEDKAVSLHLWCSLILSQLLTFTDKFTSSNQEKKYDIVSAL